MSANKDVVQRYLQAFDRDGDGMSRMSINHTFTVLGANSGPTDCQCQKMYPSDVAGTVHVEVDMHHLLPRHVENPLYIIVQPKWCL